MGKLFGTDGIRDKAGEGKLSPENVYHLGFVLGDWLRNHCVDGKEKILIGMDTRQSGECIAHQLIDGLHDHGYEALSCGVLPTAGIAYLTKKYHAALGIMISASHNPWEYNGIKIFTNQGVKLEDHEEDVIENLFFSKPETQRREQVCTIEKNDEFTQQCRNDYDEFLLSKNATPLKGKIVIDCSNGVASDIAYDVFTKLGLDVTVICNTPNGQNINDQCGALYPEQLAQKVVEENAILGLAFDGDADRLIAVDEKGLIRDGDYTMGIIAVSMAKKGLLKKNTVVSTQMSNLGLELFLKDKGCSMLRVNVGDRYVLKKLVEEGYNFGGEQSGHIIFLDDFPGGDGLLTAIKLLQVICESSETFGELCDHIARYPQLIRNLEVQKKPSLEAMPDIMNFIKKSEESLRNEGRIYIRYSGTEPLLRIMIEGKTTTIIEELSDSLYDKLEEAING